MLLVYCIFHLRDPLVHDVKDLLFPDRIVVNQNSYNKGNRDAHNKKESGERDQHSLVYPVIVHHGILMNKKRASAW